MAMLQVDYFSASLQMSTSMNVILPDTAGDGGKRCPVLYLLHGLSDDHTIWCRRTSIERYAAEYGIAVVMPNGHRSFYADTPDRGRYWTLVSEEVPALAARWFPVSDKREHSCAAGLSMGGYGAFLLALRRPDRFAAAASLSGALDMAGTLKRLAETDRGETGRIFGSAEDFEASEYNLFRLVDCLGEGKEALPRLWQCCGTEDFLYEGNLRFRDFLKGKGFDHTYTEGPGAHTWDYWDREIQNALAWMFKPAG